MKPLRPQRSRRKAVSPGRLLATGVVLLWVVSPVLLGGLVTLAVRGQNQGGIGIGRGIVLVIGGILAFLTLIGGFAALVAAVVGWVRSREQRHVYDFAASVEAEESPRERP